MNEKKIAANGRREMARVTTNGDKQRRGGTLITQHWQLTIGDCFVADTAEPEDAALFDRIAAVWNAASPSRSLPKGTPTSEDIASTVQEAIDLRDEKIGELLRALDEAHAELRQVRERLAAFEVQAAEQEATRLERDL